MTDTLSNLDSGLLGALIGSILGGIITFLVARCQVKEEKKNEQKRRDDRIRGFLEAIQTEIDVAWGQYNERVGSDLNSIPEHHPFLFKFLVHSDYFSVYHANTNLLVEISNREIRHQIVKTYTLAKGQLDSFQYNTSVVEQYDILNASVEISSSENLELKKQALYSELVAYAGKLKFGNSELASQIALLSKTITTALSSEKSLSR